LAHKLLSVLSRIFDGEDKLLGMMLGWGIVFLIIGTIAQFVATFVRAT
jgi:hypothetical protein